MRDPVFYRWHQFVDDLFTLFKDSLPSYNTQNVRNPNHQTQNSILILIPLSAQLPRSEYQWRASQHSWIQSQHLQHPLDQERRRFISWPRLCSSRINSGTSSAPKPRSLLLHDFGQQHEQSRGHGYCTHIHGSEIRRQGRNSERERAENAHDRNGQVHRQT